MSNDFNWEEGKDLPSAWAKFENVGDTFVGTLIGKREQEGPYGVQMVYELQQNDGNVINVGIRKREEIAKDFVNNQMRRVVFGTIVGFKYVSDVESVAFKGKKAKSIQVKIFGTDSNYVEQYGGMTKEVSTDDIPFD